MFSFSKKQPETPQNIDEIIAQFNELKEQHAALKAEMEALKKESFNNLNRIGITRYNPFSGLGSNQSFSLAILNCQNNGVVITSLFSRDGNRVYGKPLQQGTSEFKLSQEEQQAIQLAQEKAKS